MYDDALSWNELPNDELWIFDKLILSRKLNYVCGPVGADVPSPGRYIVRPVTNFIGMGKGAEIVWIDDDTDHLPVGHFWCELFEGRHLSVDFKDGEQVLCVEGHRHTDSPLYKWDRWERVDDQVPYPSVLDKVYPHVNCEMIGGKIIEIHLRHNPDFIHGADEWFPVWEGQSTVPPPGMRFVSDPDYMRLGFFVR